MSEEKRNKRLLMARVVSGLNVISVVIYCFVALQLSSESGASSCIGGTDSEQGWSIVPTLLFVLTLIASRLLRGEDPETKRWQNYFVKLIIKYFLTNLIAVGGLVYSIISGEPIWALSCAIVALIPMLYWWPRQAAVMIEVKQPPTSNSASEIGNP